MTSQCGVIEDSRGRVGRLGRVDPASTYLHPSHTVSPFVLNIRLLDRASYSSWIRFHGLLFSRSFFRVTWYCLTFLDTIAYDATIGFGLIMTEMMEQLDIRRHVLERNIESNLLSTCSGEAMSYY